MTMPPFGRRGFRASTALAMCVAASAAVASQTSAPRVFGRVLLLETTSETSASVSLGDIDGNRTLDVILAKRRHWPLVDQILRNEGKGHFTTQPLSDAPDRTTAAALADLDGDGDIVASNDTPDRKLSYLNDGAGAFSTCASLATQSVTIIVASGRDGDGVSDVVVGDERDGLFVYVGAGPRTFDAPVALPSACGAPYAVAIADRNRDAKPDLVVGRQEAVGSVLFNTGGVRVPRFTDTPWGDGKGSVYGVAVGALDDDGWPDIAAARLEAPNAVWFGGAARR